MTGRLPGAATVHHGLMAGTMTWMIVAMPVGATAVLLATYFLVAAVPWIYSAGRRRSADALCHAAMSLAMGFMVLMR
jgi:di/tricarboxylate transporter